MQNIIENMDFPRSSHSLLSHLQPPLVAVPHIPLLWHRGDVRVEDGPHVCGLCDGDLGAIAAWTHLAGALEGDD